MTQNSDKFWSKSFENLIKVHPDVYKGPNPDHPQHYPLKPEHVHENLNPNFPKIQTWSTSADYSGGWFSSKERYTKGSICRSIFHTLNKTRSYQYLPASQHFPNNRVLEEILINLGNAVAADLKFENDKRGKMFYYREAPENFRPTDYSIYLLRHYLGIPLWTLASELSEDVVCLAQDDSWEIKFTKYEKSVSWGGYRVQFTTSDLLEAQTALCIIKESQSDPLLMDDMAVLRSMDKSSSDT